MIKTNKKRSLNKKASKEEWTLQTWCLIKRVWIYIYKHTCQHLEGRDIKGFNRIYLHLSSRQSSAYNECINLGHNKNTLEAKLNFHDHKAFLFGCSTHALDMTTFPMGELINYSLFSCSTILPFICQILGCTVLRSRRICSFFHGLFTRCQKNAQFQGWFKY